MVIIRIEGGLGNQLFQYAFGKSLAKKLNTKLLIDKSKYFSSTEKRDFVLDKLGLNFDGFYKGYSNKYLFKASSKLPKLFYKDIIFYKEKFFHFDPSVFFLINGNSYYFNGYWQSYKYFSDYILQIKNDVKINNLLVENEKIIKKVSDNHNLSIHVRGGDYRYEPFLSFNGLLKSDYYNACYKQIKKNKKIKNVYIFTDDLEYLNKISEGFDFEFEVISKKYTFTALEDFALLSKSKNIIISNSTFAWWSALLSMSNNVWYPAKWFEVKYNNTKDLFPPAWNII
jgi:hypothetical protein